MNTESIPQIRRWRAFAVLAVSFFMTVVDLTIVNVALPTIGRDLHFSESNLQWVVTAYGLTFGGFLLLGGRAADLLGRRRFDPLGAITVTGGLLVLVYALSKAPEVGWGAARTVTLLAASAASLVAFLVVETRVEAPLMPLRIFRLRAVAAANAVGLLLGGSFFGFIFIGTLYMQQVLGYSALQTGVAWLAASLTSVALAGLAQMLVTRMAAGPVMALGMALIAGGALWATRVPVHGHFWSALAGAFFIAGAGTAFAFIPVSIAGLAGVSEREAGLASGLLNTSQQLGGAIGVALASTVAATHFNTLTGDGKTVNAALTGGFQWAFWVCGAIGLLALPTVVLLRRKPTATGIERPVPALEAEA